MKANWDKNIKPGTEEGKSADMKRLLVSNIAICVGSLGEE